MIKFNKAILASLILAIMATTTSKVFALPVDSNNTSSTDINSLTNFDSLDEMAQTPISDASRLLIMSDNNKLAFAPGGNCPGMPGGNMCPMSDKLNLSDDQYSKLWQLHTDFMDTLQPKKAQLEIKKRHLTLALSADNIDSAKVKELEDSILTLKAELAKLKIEHRINAMKVLNSDQRKEVNHTVFWMAMSHHMHNWGK